MLKCTYKYMLHITLCFCIILSCNSILSSQAASELFPDIVEFKLEFPIDDEQNDYTGVAYEDRDDPHIKNDIETNLDGYIAPSPYSDYFFVSGDEMVFKSHCAGALTSINAYPRCELRERINGEDTFWSYQDEQELNATFRVTHLPDLKQEVCMLQMKGTNTPETTSGTSEVFRVEYRADGSQGLHITINEGSSVNDVMDYALDQTLKARLYVNNGHVWIELENLTTGDIYETDYDSDYSHGYFKAGAYTQSSIWEEKNGVGDEEPEAYGEVRFSEFYLGPEDGGGDPICNAYPPTNRTVSNITENAVDVSWDDIPNIDHYNVRYRETGSAVWNFIYSLQVPNTPIEGLIENTEYEWQVRAKCADGSASEYSDGQGPDFITDSNGSGCVPSIPENRQVCNITEDSAEFSWTEVPDIDHYNVRYRKVGDTNWSFIYSLQEPIAYASGLNNETLYEWQVRAKCADGSGSNYNDGQGPDFTTNNGNSGCIILCEDWTQASPNTLLITSLVINPTIIVTNQDIVNITYVVYNASAEPMTDISLDSDASLFSGMPFSTEIDPVWSGDPNNNGQLDPDEFWFYSVTKSFDFNELDTFIISAGVTGQGNCGEEVGANAALLFTYINN